MFPVLSFDPTLSHSLPSTHLKLVSFAVYAMLSALLQVFVLLCGKPFPVFFAQIISANFFKLSLSIISYGKMSYATFYLYLFCPGAFSAFMLTLKPLSQGIAHGTVNIDLLLVICPG